MEAAPQATRASQRQRAKTQTKADVEAEIGNAHDDPCMGPATQVTLRATPLNPVATGLACPKKAFKHFL